MKNVAYLIIASLLIPPLPARAAGTALDWGNVKWDGGSSNTLTTDTPATTTNTDGAKGDKPVFHTLQGEPNYDPNDDGLFYNYKEDTASYTDLKTKKKFFVSTEQRDYQYYAYMMESIGSTFEESVFGKQRMVWYMDRLTGTTYVFDYPESDNAGTATMPQDGWSGASPPMEVAVDDGTDNGYLDEYEEDDGGNPGNPGSGGGGKIYAYQGGGPNGEFSGKDFTNFAEGGVSPYALTSIRGFQSVSYPSGPAPIVTPTVTTTVTSPVMGSLPYQAPAGWDSNSGAATYGGPAAPAKVPAPPKAVKPGVTIPKLSKGSYDNLVKIPFKAFIAKQIAKAGYKASAVQFNRFRKQSNLQDGQRALKLNLELSILWLKLANAMKRATDAKDLMGKSVKSPEGAAWLNETSSLSAALEADLKTNRVDRQAERAALDVLKNQLVTGTVVKPNGRMAELLQNATAFKAPIPSQTVAASAIGLISVAPEMFLSDSDLMTFKGLTTTETESIGKTLIGASLAAPNVSSVTVATNPKYDPAAAAAYKYWTETAKVKPITSTTPNLALTSPVYDKMLQTLMTRATQGLIGSTDGKPQLSPQQGLVSGMESFRRDIEAGNGLGEAGTFFKNLNEAYQSQYDLGQIPLALKGDDLQGGPRLSLNKSLTVSPDGLQGLLKAQKYSAANDEASARAELFKAAHAASEYAPDLAATLAALGTIPTSANDPNLPQANGKGYDFKDALDKLANDLKNYMAKIDAYTPAQRAEFAAYVAKMSLAQAKIKTALTAKEIKAMNAALPAAGSNMTFDQAVAKFNQMLQPEAVETSPGTLTVQQLSRPVVSGLLGSEALGKIDGQPAANSADAVEKAADLSRAAKTAADFATRGQLQGQFVGDLASAYSLAQGKFPNQDAALAMAKDPTHYGDLLKVANAAAGLSGKVGAGAEAFISDIMTSEAAAIDFKFALTHAKAGNTAQARQDLMNAAAAAAQSPNTSSTALALAALGLASSSNPIKVGSTNMDLAQALASLAATYEITPAELAARSDYKDVLASIAKNEQPYLDATKKFKGAASGIPDPLIQWEMAYDISVSRAIDLINQMGDRLPAETRAAALKNVRESFLRTTGAASANLLGVAAQMANYVAIAGTLEAANDTVLAAVAMLGTARTKNTEAFAASAGLLVYAFEKDRLLAHSVIDANGKIFDPEFASLYTDNYERTHKAALKDAALTAGITWAALRSRPVLTALARGTGLTATEAAQMSATIVDGMAKFLAAAGFVGIGVQEEMGVHDLMSAYLTTDPVEKERLAKQGLKELTDAGMSMTALLATVKILKMGGFDEPLLPKDLTKPLPPLKTPVPREIPLNTAATPMTNAATTGMFRAEPGNSLASLEPGRYIGLIAEGMDPVLMPAFVEGNSKNYAGSHKAIWDYMVKALGGKTPKILGSFDFVIVGEMDSATGNVRNVTNVFSNRSGNFPGGTENLDFSMELLESKYGLKLSSGSSKATILDYSKVDRNGYPTIVDAATGQPILDSSGKPISMPEPHTTAQADIDALLKISTNAALSRVLVDAVEFHSWALGQIPAPGKLGMIDTARVNATLLTMSTDDMMNYSNAAYALGWFNTESPAFMVKQMTDPRNPIKLALVEEFLVKYMGATPRSSYTRLSQAAPIELSVTENYTKLGSGTYANVYSFASRPNDAIRIPNLNAQDMRNMTGADLDAAITGNKTPDHRLPTAKNAYALANTYAVVQDAVGAANVLKLNGVVSVEMEDGSLFWGVAIENAAKHGGPLGSTFLEDIHEPIVPLKFPKNGKVNLTFLKSFVDLLRGLNSKQIIGWDMNTQNLAVNNKTGTAVLSDPEFFKYDLNVLTQKLHEAQSSYGTTFSEPRTYTAMAKAGFTVPHDLNEVPDLNAFIMYQNVEQIESFIMDFERDFPEAVDAFYEALPTYLKTWKK
jgi:hypothetical protein